jgi:hypothetical protein
MDARMVRLSDLLESVASGAAVLPDFQRDFDWSENDVRSLLVTVLSGWPAGSLLLMDGESTFFRVRSFEGALTASESPEVVVLDGQQRLTALYHAFHDAGDYVYALDWSRSEDFGLESLEDAVLSFKRTDWSSQLKDVSEQRKRKLMPLSALASAADYFSWRDEILSSTPSHNRDALSRRLTALYRDQLAEVHGFEFPVVTIGGAVEPSAVARIFERVNRTGMRLSAFDLVVARVYTPNWNLRDHWDAVRAESVLIDTFLRDDGMPILQTIALKNQRDVRQSAVLNLQPEIIREQWDGAAAAVQDALEVLVGECGVARPEWLPYRGMILPLAGLAYSHDLGHCTDLIRKWFFSRSFSLAFDAAANTRLVADFQLLESALRGESELGVQPASATVLLEATRRRQAPIWRAFLCLLARRDARDLTGETLGLADAAETGRPITGDVVPVPVFATGLRPDPEAEPLHLRVLNLVLASRKSARDVRKYELASLIEESVEASGRRAVDAALKSQLLPASRKIPALEKDWRAFLDARLAELAKALRVEAGQSIEVEELKER